MELRAKTCGVVVNDGIRTSDGFQLTVAETVTFSGDWDSINMYINAGCPEPPPNYPNGCPILTEDTDAR